MGCRAERGLPPSPRWQLHRRRSRSRAAAAPSDPHTPPHLQGESRPRRASTAVSTMHAQAPSWSARPSPPPLRTQTSRSELRSLPAPVGWVPMWRRARSSLAWCRWGVWRRPSCPPCSCWWSGRWRWVGFGMRLPRPAPPPRLPIQFPDPRHCLRRRAPPLLTHRPLIDGEQRSCPCGQHRPPPPARHERLQNIGQMGDNPSGMMHRQPASDAAVFLGFPLSDTLQPNTRHCGVRVRRLSRHGVTQSRTGLPQTHAPDRLYNFRYPAPQITISRRNTSRE